VEVVGAGTEPRVPVLAVALASATDLLAIAAALMGQGRPLGYLVAAALHLVAVVPLLVTRQLAGSRRSLMLALAATLPAVGVLLGALALGTPGRAELATPLQDEGLPAPVLDPAQVRRVAEAPSTCEAFLIAGPEERRAILAALTRRGDAGAVALLRWALSAAPPELAVEAALALEELRAGFDERLEECRAKLSSLRSPAAALAAGSTVVQALESGIVEPALMGMLSAEARRYFGMVVERDPDRASALVELQARLELVVMRPEEALRLIDEALPRAGVRGRPALYALREKALLASHDIPWEGPSMMATYRPPPPPPLDGRQALRALAVAGGARGADR
jgi:hypothetical protein